MMDFSRLHSVDAEQSVLGALLIPGSNAVDRIGSLKPGHFFTEAHRIIFAEIMAMSGKAIAIDPVTVAEQLDAAGLSEKTGGLAYLGELSMNTPSAANIGRYAQMVLDKAMERELVAASDRNAMSQILTASMNGQNNLAAEQMRQQTAMAGGVPVGRQREAGNPLVDELNRTKVQAGQLENQQSQRLNDLQGQLVAETDPAKQAAIAAQIKALSGSGGQSRQGDTLTMPQRRSNLEIEAARKTVEGLTAEEIKRKTAKTTNTGRENPDFDPSLERAVSLAGRRMYGADDNFDQRQQAQQPVGTDGDPMTRFKADKAMAGHTTGKVTEQGVEVIDATGKLIGHYR